MRDHPDLGPALRAAYREMLRFDLTSPAPGIPAGGEDVPERLGDHRLIERLGAGGMGVVYLAHDEVLQRTVALKLIRPEHLFLPGARERFQREVETIARLEHPGIVPIYGVDKANGVPFFTMQHINGCSLAHALGQLQQERQLDGRALLRITAASAGESAGSSSGSGSSRGSGSDSHGIEDENWPDTCVSIAGQVASALHHAHERGVLHRDVKPSNILLTTAGRAMLVDFGLAWSDEADQRLTMSNSQLGSLPYLPPEHIDGKAPDPSRATDVYSLGVTLYEMLTLRNPFLGRNGEETRRNILAAQPGRLRGRTGVSWELETVCMTAMDPDPSKRYRTMLAFQRDLERVLANEPIEARRPGFARRARRWMQRHPTTMVAAAVALLSLMVALSVFGVQQHRLREVAEIERYGALVSNADVELRVGSRPVRARLLLEQCRPRDRGWEWHHLEFTTDQSLTEPKELDGSIQCVRWCPDGQRYVAATQNETLVCCSADGEILWQRKNEATASLAFRPRGNDHELICGSLHGELRAFDLATGEPLATFETGADAPQGELSAIAI
ncbi:MAG TPA: serine/threonine protein kinase, partial [bacterium]|nr:serine/threonine protein kinase [bacterium]